MISDEVRAQIEQNANTVFEETREFVAEMEPSLTAATIAFDMLLREASKELIMADWTESERSHLDSYIDHILKMKFVKAFSEASTEAEALRNPPISAGVLMTPENSNIN